MIWYTLYIHTLAEGHNLLLNKQKKHVYSTTKWISNKPEQYFFFFVSLILYNAFDDFDMLARLFSYKNEIINCASDEVVDY